MSKPGSAIFKMGILWHRSQDTLKTLNRITYKNVSSVPDSSYYYWGGESFLSPGVVFRDQTEKKQSTMDSLLIQPSVIWGKQNFKAAFKIMKSLAARRRVQPKTQWERCAEGGVYPIPTPVPFLKGHLSHQRRPQGRACCEPLSNGLPSVLKSRTKPLMFNI